MRTREPESMPQAGFACMRSVRGPQATEPPLAGRSSCRLRRYGAPAALSHSGHRQQPEEHLDGRELQASEATAKAPLELDHVCG